MALFQDGDKVALREGALFDQRQREALILPFSKLWRRDGMTWDQALWGF